MAVIVYKANYSGMSKIDIYNFTLSVDICSTDYFNAKVKVAVLQQRQDLEVPQIKYLRLVIPEHYTFMASNILSAALGILRNYLEKNT